MTHVYHYCAVHHADGKPNYIHGLIRSDRPILTEEQYLDARKRMSPDHFDRMSVLSLTKIETLV